MPESEERSRRLLLHVPVRVEGEGKNGAPFSAGTQTVNVSGTGAAFDLAEELLVGTRLHLAFELPENLRPHFGGQARYEVRAVVIRLEHVEGASSFRTAVRFVGDE